MRNKFAVPCKACGNIAEVGAGLLFKRGGKWEVVHERCPAGLAGDYRSPAFSVMYQGCADEQESLHEWFADHFDNESHFLGWEVGDQ